MAQRWDNRVAFNVDKGDPTLWPMEGSDLGLRWTHPQIGRNNDSAFSIIRNMKKAIAGVLVVYAMFLTPERGCCRRITRTYSGWVLSSAVFRHVRSCLPCDDAHGFSCGWWGSRFIARLSKTKKKKTNNPTLDNNADVFSWKSWINGRKFRKFTSSIRTALTAENA